MALSVLERSELAGAQWGQQWGQSSSQDRPSRPHKSWSSSGYSQGWCSLGRLWGTSENFGIREDFGTGEDVGIAEDVGTGEGFGTGGDFGTGEGFGTGGF